MKFLLFLSVGFLETLFGGPKTLFEPIPAENFRFSGRYSPRTFVWNDDCVWFGQPIDIQELNPTPLQWEPLFAHLEKTGWSEAEPFSLLGGSEKTRCFVRKPGIESFRSEFALIEPNLNIFVFTHNPVFVPYKKQLMENGGPRPDLIPGDSEAVRISWQYFEDYSFPLNPIDLALIRLCKEDSEEITRFGGRTRNGGFKNLLTGERDKYEFRSKVIPSFGHRIGQLEAYWRERGGRVLVQIGDGGRVHKVEGSFSPHRYSGITRNAYTKEELEQCLKEQFYYCDSPPFPQPDHDDWIIDEVRLDASVNETGVPQKHFQPVYVLKVRNPDWTAAQDPHESTKHCLLFVPAIPEQRAYHEAQLKAWRKRLAGTNLKPPIPPLQLEDE